MEYFCLQEIDRKMLNQNDVCSDNTVQFFMD